MHPKTILLVEDHEDSRIICATLLQHHGYTVVEARDGAAGVELARHHRPNLIVMDVTLPILDGWAATEQIKSHPDTRSIPIIALTAHALRAARDRALTLGFAAYLVKPCRPTRLLREVRRLIGPPVEELTA
jgi:two-component system, cell cycle response regulator DivK